VFNLNGNKDSEEAQNVLEFRSTTARNDAHVEASRSPIRSYEWFQKSYKK